MDQGKIGVFYNPHNDATAEVVFRLLSDKRFIDATLYKNDDMVVVLMLGGDGLALKCMHTFYGRKIPFYGINYGHLGFFMNQRSSHQLTPDECVQRISEATAIKVKHLSCEIKSPKRVSFKILAINDVSISRSSPSAAKLRLELNNEIVFSEFVGDGLVVATPIGSTGYNFSLGGPIMPLSSDLLAITPIAPRQPIGWRGALVPNSTSIKISLTNSWETYKLSVDGIGYHDASSAIIKLDTANHSLLLLDEQDVIERKAYNMMFLKHNA